MSFNGVSDYIVITDKLVFGGPELTIEFRAKWLDWNNWSKIFDFGEGKADFNVFASTYGKNKRLEMANYVRTSKD